MRVISGKCRGVRLETLDGMETRPTTERVKESVFSALQFELEEKVCLDLFAGSGQLGIEALSRGAGYADFVDRNRDAIQIVQKNLSHAKLSDYASVFNMDSLEYLKRCKKKYDIIFIDPPYQTSLLENSLLNIKAFDILTPNGIIVAEYPKDKIIDFFSLGFNAGRSYGFGIAKVTILRYKESQNG